MRRARSGQADQRWWASLAEVYDVDAPLSTESYAEAHDAVRDLVCACVRSPGLRRGRRKRVSVLDLGAGTGAEALRLLAALPECDVVAVDASLEMLRVLQRKSRKLLTAGAAERRLRTVVADVRQTAACMVAARQALRSLNGSNRFDVVVTALALHHFDAAEKLRIYTSLRRVLRRTGILVMLDVYAYRDTLMDRMATDRTLGWIEAQHHADTTRFKGRVRALGTASRSLAREWIRHVLQDNRPLPIESPPSAGTQRRRAGGAPPTGERDLLLAAGFGEIECPYRLWQTAVLWARVGAPDRAP